MLALGRRQLAARLTLCRDSMVLQELRKREGQNRDTEAKESDVDQGPTVHHAHPALQVWLECQLQMLMALQMAGTCAPAGVRWQPRLYVGVLAVRHGL